jgi:hypothetical protein
MGLLALVDSEGRPIAFILGNYRIQIWSHMEAASMEELNEVLSAADFNRRNSDGGTSSGADEAGDKRSL